MEQQYMDEFIANRELALRSKNTIETYTRSLKNMYKAFQHKKCSELGIIDIKNYIINQKWTKRNTYLLHIMVLKMFFRFLEKKKYIDKNPIEEVATPHPEETPMPMITQNELDKLDAMANNIEKIPLLNRLWYWLIKETGLRSQEIKSIMLEDLNLRERLLYIKNSKGKVTKLLTFSSKVEGLFKEWLMERPPVDNYIFKGKKNNLLGRRHVWFAINLIFQEAFCWDWHKKSGGHILRHIAATQWVANGGNLQGLKWMMGWKGYSQVERYVHQSPAIIKKMFKEANGKKNSI